MYFHRGDGGAAITSLLAAAPNTMANVMSTGTVRHWYRDDGWGVLDSPDTPGGCFAHFSRIIGVSGFRELAEDETVDFDWQPSAYPGSQDGYSFVGTEVVRRQQSSSVS